MFNFFFFKQCILNLAKIWVFTGACCVLWLITYLDVFLVGGHGTNQGLTLNTSLTYSCAEICFWLKIWMALLVRFYACMFKSCDQTAIYIYKYFFIIFFYLIIFFFIFFFIVLHKSTNQMFAMLLQWNAIYQTFTGCPWWWFLKIYLG